jgi:arylformamidase
MGETVYLDYDGDTLYAEYNNRAKVPEFEAINAGWHTRSEEIRAGNPEARIDIAYGDHPRATFDLFLPQVPIPPLHAFIHGGYWQWNDKENYAFLARPFLDAGIAFANIEYPHCPDVDLTELVRHVRSAFAYLWRNAGELGFDRENIQVSGNSAGGHLTGAMLTTDWPGFASDLPRNLIKSGIPISGIYDLEPIRHTTIGDPLGLDPDSARAQSPMFAPPRPGAEMVVALGAHEGREFHRQAEEFAANVRRHGVDVRIASIPGANHFTVLESLADSNGTLFQAAKVLLNR